MRTLSTSVVRRTRSLQAVAGPVVQIDEGRIQADLDEVVRSTVEETLNALLDAEADRLCGAGKYERSEGRKDTRAGSYDRHLQTKAGEVTLTVPKLRSLPFETAIIERYRRRESSVEEALIEIYLAGVFDLLFLAMSRSLTTIAGREQLTDRACRGRWSVQSHHSHVFGKGSNPRRQRTTTHARTRTLRPTFNSGQPG